MLHAAWSLHSLPNMFGMIPFVPFRILSIDPWQVFCFDPTAPFLHVGRGERRDTWQSTGYLVADAS